MERFKHYIVTRFNVGLYNPQARTSEIFQSTDAWMQHRMRLFMTFTAPSIILQTCQNFTWLLCVDEATPPIYREMLESLPWPNVRLIRPRRWAGQRLHRQSRPRPRRTGRL